MTLCLTRPAFLAELGERAQAAQRSGNAFSLLLVDVDHLQNINDCHGVAAGEPAHPQPSPQRQPQATGQQAGQAADGQRAADDGQQGGVGVRDQAPRGGGAVHETAHGADATGRRHRVG